VLYVVAAQWVHHLSMIAQRLLVNLVLLPSGVARMSNLAAEHGVLTVTWRTPMVA